MNNYQAQQTWDSVIGFGMFIIMVGFMVGMVGSFWGEGEHSLEEKYRIVKRTKRGSLVVIEREGDRAIIDVTDWEDMRDLTHLLDVADIRFNMYQPPKLVGKGWRVEFNFADLESVMNEMRLSSLLLEEPKEEKELSANAWRGRDNLIDVIRRQVKAEIIWGEGKEGMKLWLAKNEGLRRQDEASWGKIENVYVILFHGTDSSIVPRILQEGLVQRYEMIGKTKEELTKEEWEDVREMGFGYAVWFAATPYGAFFYNDTALQVKIPLNWISYFDESGFMVERSIPPEMIVKVMSFREWTGEEWSG